MNYLRPCHRSLHRPPVAKLLHGTLQAATLDEFARGCQRLLTLTMPHHSLCVSFNDMEYFSPSLIHDTLPLRCDVAYMSDRYSVFDPTHYFLRQHTEVTQSVFRDQLECMPERERKVYCERFMQREGWDKYAEIHFTKGGRHQSTICVRRAPEHRDFNADDLRFLNDLREIFAACVNRLHRQHRERITTEALRDVMLRMPVPLIFLDWALRPICYNFEARRLCVDWLHGASRAQSVKLADEPEIPEEILEACEQRKRRILASLGAPVPAGERFQPRFASVLHPSRPELSAQVEPIDTTHPQPEWPNFLVRLHKLVTPAFSPSASSALQLEQAVAGSPSTEPASQTDGALALLACLTRCEREIAVLTRTGLTNHEMARRLHKSEATVKMQLHSIFRKLRISNRTQLAMRLK